MNTERFSDLCRKYMHLGEYLFYYLNLKTTLDAVLNSILYWKISVQLWYVV